MAEVKLEEIDEDGLLANNDDQRDVSQSNVIMEEELPDKEDDSESYRKIN